MNSWDLHICTRDYFINLLQLFFQAYLFNDTMRRWYGSFQVSQKLYYPPQIRPKKNFEDFSQENLHEEKELKDFFLGREVPNDFAVLHANKGYGTTQLAKKYLETEPTPFWEKFCESFLRIFISFAQDFQPDPEPAPKFYFACKARSENNFWRMIASNFGLDYGLYFLSFFPRVVDSTYHCKIISTCI